MQNKASIELFISGGWDYRIRLKNNSAYLVNCSVNTQYNKKLIEICN